MSNTIFNTKTQKLRVMKKNSALGEATAFLEDGSSTLYILLNGIGLSEIASLSLAMTKPEIRHREGFSPEAISIQ